LFYTKTMSTTTPKQQHAVSLSTSVESTNDRTKKKAKIGGHDSSAVSSSCNLSNSQECDTKETQTSGNIRTVLHRNNKLLSDRIIERMIQVSNPHTRAYFMNQVQGTQWLGCYVPQSEEILKDVMTHYLHHDDDTHGTTTCCDDDRNRPDHPQRSELLSSLSVSSTSIYWESMKLIKHEACDVKIVGMMLLMGYIPLPEIATIAILDHLENELFLQNPTIINDYSTADDFALRVLQPIAYDQENDDPNSTTGTGSNILSSYPLADRILQFATAKNDMTTTIWHRRCGIVPFVNHIHGYAIFKTKKKAMKSNLRYLPKEFTFKLIDACEQNLLRTPNERFTKTGIASVLRFVLASSSESSSSTIATTAETNNNSSSPQEEDATSNDSASNSPRQVALNMIVRYSSLWTPEVKKKFVRKLKPNDPIRQIILSLK
jgi:hypothetical protein